MSMDTAILLVLTGTASAISTLIFTKLLDFKPKQRGGMIDHSDLYLAMKRVKKRR